MKTLTFLCALLAASLTSPVFGQQTSTSNVDRESYEDNSAQELRQLRSQVDAAARSAPQTAQAGFAQVYDSLVQAEDALAAVKTAPELEMKTRRQEFEVARARAARTWNDFRVARSSTPNTTGTEASSM